jgi:hypothetical protein
MRRRRFLWLDWYEQHLLTRARPFVYRSKRSCCILFQHVHPTTIPTFIQVFFCNSPLLRHSHRPERTIDTGQTYDASRSKTDRIPSALHGCDPGHRHHKGCLLFQRVTGPNNARPRGGDFGPYVGFNFRFPRVVLT